MSGTSLGALSIVLAMQGLLTLSTMPLTMLPHQDPGEKLQCTYWGHTYQQWYKPHYALPLSCKRVPEEEELFNKKQSMRIQKKYDDRKNNARISSLWRRSSSRQASSMHRWRPGLCDPGDCCVLEGKGLEFFLRKTKNRKDKWGLLPPLLDHVIKIFVVLKKDLISLLDRQY